MRPRSRSLAVVSACVAAAAIAPVCVSAAAEPPPPANDAQASPTVIHALPATLSGTTVGATTEAGETESSCEFPTLSSVWYSLRAASAERIAVDLSASGALDASIDVYHALRSQLSSVACERTDSEGKASVSFKASKNGVYFIRVAALKGSELNSFTFNVFLPTPAVRPPGPALPAGGVFGHVDPIQNINAAYSVQMHEGVSYLINLSHPPHACVNGALYAPGTQSFEETPSVTHIGCGGYRLFTPGPGKGGRYSFNITPRHRGVEHFHLEIAPAGPSETAPGIALGNYEHAHGRLDGKGVQVLRLYRVDVTGHSNLTLRLRAPSSADFNLQLRNDHGNVIECQCGGSGSETLQHQLQGGRYYAVVSVRDATAGNFTLVRESRTITATGISFSSAHAAAGQGLSIDVKVAPAASGPVTVDVERFDPVFGWQFFREFHPFASAGSASVPFTPPAVGRFRAQASYEGSRTASPSAVGFTYLLVS